MLSSAFVSVRIPFDNNFTSQLDRPSLSLRQSISLLPPLSLVTNIPHVLIMIESKVLSFFSVSQTILHRI